MKMKKGITGKVLYVAEAVILLVVFLFGFRQERTLYTLSGQEIPALTESGEYEGESFSLTPGVYRITLRAELGAEESLFAEICSEQTYYKALRANRVNMSGGQTEQSFLVYVLDRIPAVNLRCGFSGTGAEALSELTLRKTALGSRMLFLLFLTGFLCLDFLLWFRRQVLAGKISKKKQVAFWSLLIGSFIGVLPCFTDYISFGVDTGYHLQRIAFLADTLREGGQFPVRIQSTWMYGHGYATSLFYGDFFLYLPALWNLAGFSTVTAYKLLILFMTLGTAAISWFSFYACVREEYPALAGSLVYLLMPFRLFSIYNKGAMGECLALMCLPLVVCGIYLLYTRPTEEKEYSGYKWYLIAGMSGLLQCHLLTTEMAVLLIALVCLIFWKRTFTGKRFFRLFQSALLTAALNAWFLIPLLFMLGTDTYHVSTVTKEPIQERGAELAGYLQLLPHKGEAATGMWQIEPVHIGAAALGVLFLWIIWKIAGKRHEKLQRNGRTAEAASGSETAVALFCILLLVMSMKYLPWDRAMELPVVGGLVGALQFPTRWMLPASAVAALFVTLFCSTGQSGKNKTCTGQVLLGVALAVTVFSGLYQVNDIARESKAIYLYDIENIGTTGVGNGEYLLAETDTAEVSYHAPQAEAGILWTDYTKKGTTVDITLENSTDEAKYLELPLFGYRGYRVEELENFAGDTAVEAPVITEERGSHGDLRLRIPAAYQGRLRIAYRESALFRVADVISLVTAAGILLKILSGHLKGRIPEERLTDRRLMKEKNGKGEANEE